MAYYVPLGTAHCQSGKWLGTVDNAVFIFVFNFSHFVTSLAWTFSEGLSSSKGLLEVDLNVVDVLNAD